MLLTKGGNLLSKNGNGNGHQVFWNPVKIFIRLVLGRWMKEDKITGERFLVDAEDVRRELDDIADEPHDDSLNDN
jgi:hypothetical protein